MIFKSEIFEKNYDEYCARLAQIDFEPISKKLGLTLDDNWLFVPFFQNKYRISRDGITDLDGKRPNYMTCVIIARYILNCPDNPPQDTTWVSFKDFKKDAAIVNVNYFTSDTEKAIVNSFSGCLEDLKNACEKVGGIAYEADYNFDIIMKFKALPHISLLLLFNEQDEDFPAACSVLFYKQSEYYLDPESLAMIGTVLAKSLKNL